ncbi:M-phase phosphoprotein 8 [Allomyces arbusculus]|nr:M-phase phosphoprotein 8 [Allomyces arbusculus]
MSSRKTTKVPQVEEVRRPVSDDESDDGEEEFEVEKILDHKAKKDGQMMYYLKWKGYAIDDATWEDTDCLTSCEDLLRDYWAKKGCDIHGRPLKTGSAPTAAKKSAVAAAATTKATAPKPASSTSTSSSSSARKRDIDTVAPSSSTSAARRRDAEPASSLSSSSSSSRKREHEPAPSTSTSAARRRDTSPRAAPSPSATTRKRDPPTSSTASVPTAKRARTSSAAAAPVTPSPTTPDPAAAPYDLPDDEHGMDGMDDSLLPPGDVYAPMNMGHEQKLDPNLASWDDLVEEILTLDMDPTSKQPYVYLKLKSGEQDWARVLTSVARYKIPQRLIDFYESRLTFKFLEEEPATQDAEEDAEQAA